MWSIQDQMAEKDWRIRSFIIKRKTDLLVFFGKCIFMDIEMLK